MSAKTKKENRLKGGDGAVESHTEGSTSCTAIAQPEQFFDESGDDKHHEKRRLRRKHRPNCKEKTINCIKITCIFMLSYVGLTCIVIGYSILGGFIFNALEQENELKVEQKALTVRKNLTKDIQTAFSASYKIILEKSKDSIRNEVSNFIDKTVQLIDDFNNRTIQLIENFNNMSTADYKNSTNQSNYELSGIIKDVENINLETKELVNKMGQSIIDNMTEYVSNATEKTFGDNDVLNGSKVKGFQLETYKLVNVEGWNGVDPDSTDGTKWTYSGSLLYSVTVITTIGYGTITPKTGAGRAVTILYALIGIPLTVLCITNIGRGMASFCRAVYGGTFCVECRQQLFNSIKTRRFSVYTAEEIELEKVGKGPDCEPKTKVVVHNKHAEVPLHISLILVTLYILFGAIMFKFWEDKWSHFESAYFCFITLSTIGFGDFVPGFTDKDWDNQVKQIACSLYLLIGLSTLAMCFDLMQQRGKEIANNFATSIGLVRKTNNVDSA